jgi:hypothetical protein
MRRVKGVAVMSAAELAVVVELAVRGLAVVASAVVEWLAVELVVVEPSAAVAVAAELALMAVEPTRDRQTPVPQTRECSAPRTGSRGPAWTSPAVTERARRSLASVPARRTFNAARRATQSRATRISSSNRTWG